ncbi:PREDICTED: protein FAR1-RELATED SEQUENCE 5-like [Ipomoea nil]|uniref:protein FAR1-RELATED SEQUENCE 5-like n=1 Tax=Ipomoea nil TaxID=35883 RepID=UPI000900880D|nr:PREDICTED: protein FAR1-RELATED SEQUENCE 5-like [Ipomoea nil]
MESVASYVVFYLHTMGYVLAILITSSCTFVHTGEGDSYRLDISPGLTKYYVPLCEDSVKPFVGKVFPDLDTGVEFYTKYASIVGFDVRLSHLSKCDDGTTVWRYVLCNREGHKHVVCKDKSSVAELDGDAESSVKKRRRFSNRVGCGACAIFRYGGDGTYVIHRFEERHNHSLTSVMSRQFLKMNRKVGPGHMKFVADCGKVNIGPVQSFRLFGEMFGGLANVGATSLEFRNIKRDVDAFSARVDAQMITNRYDVVFTPFTGVNNHKKSITFGAGLLTKEDIESYVWLFEKFKEAMGSEPVLVVTDQDPAMRVAFPRVFKEAKHRFCMWHIMSKVGDKVGPSLSKNESFRSKLNSVVWSHYLEPAEFDHQWKVVMEEFGLLEHSWFVKMYDLRHLWIPAYFSDVSMNGLIRTTSRSESENSLFGSFTTPQSNLVEFFMHFDRAIDSQRYSINKLNSDSEACFPDLKTPLSMEKHVAYVYTLTVFYLVQAEICAACFSCRVLNVRDDQGILYYDIKDENDRVFRVVLNVAEVIASCGCKLFERVGLLCRHIFVVFKDLNLNSIPLVYVVNRWTKSASLGQSFDIDGVVVDQCRGVDEKLSDIDRLKGFSQIIKDHKDMLLADKDGCSSTVDKRSVIESICGSSVPSEVSILPPNKAKNKGSGRRIKGCKEIAIEQSKNERTCKTCNKPNHDSRNCVLRKTKDKVCGLQIL